MKPQNRFETFDEDFDGLLDDAAAAVQKQKSAMHTVELHCGFHAADQKKKPCATKVRGETESYDGPGPRALEHVTRRR